MKKLFIIAMLLMIACLGANAQKKKSSSASAKYYAGGVVGFSSTSMETEGVAEKVGGTSFMIFPEIGYNVNKKMSVGVQLGFMSGMAGFGSLSPNDIKSLILGTAGASYNIRSDSKSGNNALSIFLINPYVRYSLFSAKKFNVYAEAGFSYGAGNTRIVNDQNTPDKSDDTVSKSSISMFEIAAKPVVSYQLNNKFRILCKLGAIGFQTISRSANGVKIDSISNVGFETGTANYLFGIEYCF